MFRRHLYALRSGKRPPHIGLDVIHGNASAIGVHVAEVGLGQCITLLGGLVPPLQYLRIISGLFENTLPPSFRLRFYCKSRI